MHTETNNPPKIAYSIKEACKASSLGRTTIYSAKTLEAVRYVKAIARLVRETP